MTPMVSSPCTIRKKTTTMIPEDLTTNLITNSIQILKCLKATNNEEA